MTDQTTITPDETLPLPRWQALLEQRGILGAALECKIEPRLLHGTPGWVYPIINQYGNPAEVRAGLTLYRWKACDSNANPKYMFLPEDPQDGGPWHKPRIYFAPGFAEAVKKAGGVVIWASGEPDVWAWMSAGFRNVFCWFGEMNVPDNLVAMLQHFEIKTVLMYPDLDDTGQRAATKVKDLLIANRIGFSWYELDRDKLGDGGDINKLWIYSEFDREIFDIEVSACRVVLKGTPDEPAAPPPDPEPAKNIRDNHVGWSTTEYEDFLAKCWDWIMADCGVSKADFGVNKRSKRIACRIVSHTHDDHRPAAYLYWDGSPTSGAYCCPKCDEPSLNITQYMKLRGKDPVEFYPVRDSKPKPPHNGTAKSDDKTGWLVGWAEAGSRYEAVLDGNLPINTYPPLPIPFREMKKMGGLARNLDAGLVMGIISGSGWGKTVLVETIIDYWRSLGKYGIIWGPEWSPEKYFARAVHRKGGPSPSDVTDHKAWYADKLRGVEEHKRAGHRLTDDQLVKAREVAALVKQWPELETIDRAGVTVANLFGKFDHAGVWHNGAYDEAFIGMEAAGKRPSYAVCDYANLVMGQNGDDQFKTVAAAVDGFKQFCTRHQVSGLEVFQIDKETSKSVLAGRTQIDLESMLGARSFSLNLCVALAREIDEVTGDYTDIGKLRVTKNSEGHCGAFEL